MIKNFIIDHGSKVVEDIIGIVGGNLVKINKMWQLRGQAAGGVSWSSSAGNSPGDVDGIQPPLPPEPDPLLCPSPRAVLPLVPMSRRVPGFFPPPGAVSKPCMIIRFPCCKVVFLFNQRMFMGINLQKGN